MNWGPSNEMNMNQTQISHEATHTNVGTDNILPPSEFSLRIVGSPELVLALGLALISRLLRGGPPDPPKRRRRAEPTRPRARVRIAT
jgi:hypothetical protein